MSKILTPENHRTVTTTQSAAVELLPKKRANPHFWEGFWWHWDEQRKDWFIGPCPFNGTYP